ncbi:MAG: PPC domain-containing protein [Roseicyclus sp.]|jgi:hypothetical protein
MGLKFCTQAAVAALLVTALPAAAQTVSCGGIGDGAPWIGGTPEASDVSASGAALLLPGMSVPPGGRAVGLFSLGTPTEVRVEAAPSGAGDTVLELYDATGGLLVTDDDSGGALASRAELSLQPGSYCLAARGFGGVPVTADLQVSRIDQPALTAGLAGGFDGTETIAPFVGIDACSASTPATMLGSGPLDGMLTQGGVSATNTISGVPYYRFSLASPQQVTIRAENPSADPYIYVFDGAGGLLAENDDYESLNSRIDFNTPLQAGEYCIGMRALSDPDVPVTVSVAGFDARAAAVEQYASGDVAPPMDGSYPVSDIGVLPSRSVRDTTVIGGQAVWYSMEIDDFGMLLITADEVVDSDPLITFFNAAGEMVGMNDDSNGTLNSQLAVRVEPGRYMLGVSQYSTNYRGIIRIGMQRFVPAP